ncbi:MAG: hypothetical protein GY934_20465, partial [Gammaproteobacteria bacterium]|nr:hypothetical protein [Gammaproteobacteria bacterium]
DTTTLTEVSQTTAISHQSVGGKIYVLGNRVGLLDKSQLNASGDSGGGEVLIGGDYQGTNPNIPNSTYTFVDENVSIINDAITNGNGGKTILWSDKDTIFQGQISVKGGVESGDGGFVETSGKENLLYTGSTDRSAANGASGALLLDPQDITIQTTGADDDELNTDQTINFGDSPGTDFTISASKIAAELLNGDVLMEASRDITFANATLDYGAATNSLTLSAGRDISFSVSSGIEDASNAGGTLNLNLFASGSISLDGSIETNGGNFTVGGAGGNTPTTFTNNGTISTTGRTGVSGTTNATDGGDTDITSSGSMSAGSLEANGGTWDSGAGNENGKKGGNITLTAAEEITAGTISATGSDAFGTDKKGGTGGAVTLSAVDITVGNISTMGGDSSGNGDSQSGGNVTVTATGILNNAPSIRLNGDITSAAGNGDTVGAPGTKNISLEGIGDGSITIGAGVVFSEALTVISGTDGSDSIVVIDGDNTWDVTGSGGTAGTGTLNTEL